MGMTLSADQTRRDIRKMFAMWDIGQFTAMRDQEEYAGGRMKSGEGVTVSFFRHGEWQTVYCNKRLYAENYRAVFLFLDRMRIAEKSGVSYQALSSTKGLVKSDKPGNKSEEQENLEDAYDVLGVNKDDPTDLVKKIYKQKLGFYHPDIGGGDEEKAKRLNRAYETIMKSRGERP